MGANSKIEWTDHLLNRAIAYLKAFPEVADARA
jgi:hypothetical protein